MATTDHAPLLGRLATRWFNEVIATDALRLLLDDPALRSAFLAFISRRTSVALGSVQTFVCERAIDGGRLDLEGVDGEGRPRLIVEAKIGHTMSIEQMTRYIGHQRESLSGAASGVCALLVPASRLAKAEEIVAFLSGEAGAPEPRVVPLAISWEDCLEVMQEAAVASAPGGAISSAADVAQLRAAFGAFARWTTPPEQLPPAVHPQFWAVLLDHLRDRLPADWVGPLVSRDPGYLMFRYHRIQGTQTFYSVGVTGRFGADGVSSLWLRFHRATSDFDRVRERLGGSSFASLLVDEGGHVWLPITIDPELAGPEQVEHVARQVEQIIEAIGGPAGVRQTAANRTLQPGAGST